MVSIPYNFYGIVGVGVIETGGVEVLVGVGVTVVVTDGVTVDDIVGVNVFVGVKLGVIVGDKVTDGVGVGVTKLTQFDSSVYVPILANPVTGIEKFIINEFLSIIIISLGSIY